MDYSLEQAFAQSNLATLAASPAQHLQLNLARQDIEYLRRWYARATDALGEVDNPDAQAGGLAVYQQIFTDSCDIQVTNAQRPLRGKGWQAWSEIVTKELSQYASTQHLIGTQLVSFEAVEFDGDTVVAGRANMSSYLHAWHMWPDRQMRLVIGTYSDTVVYTPHVGWQICAMTLAFTSSEKRLLGEPT